MKYFLLDYSTKKEKVGSVYPQCEGIAEGYTHKWFEKPTSMTKLTNDVFPNNNPELIFDISDKAILTDIVSPSNISAIGLLINEKSKQIFEKFNLNSHKFYSAKVRENNNSYDYYWLHPVKKDLLGVDFNNSKFQITNIVGMPISDIAIESWDDFFEKKSNLSMKNIVPTKLFIDDTLKSDFIYLPYILEKILISEELAIEIAHQKITGIEIKEQNIL